MKQVHTDNAPKAVGPYSQAIVSNSFIFCSGQIGLDPQTGKLSDETVEGQTQQALKNLQAVIEEAGSSLNNVVKTTCYLQHMNDFQTFNEVYKQYFGETKPARATIEVAKLPLGALVEIEAIAEIT